ncbi:C6 finger domain protein [Aspergillus pseudonomiae]|nr:C6 finger domain protein [Aspergillus pseudonomiae]
MAITSTDNAPKMLPAFSELAIPKYLIPPDGSHSQPSIPGIYEQQWRYYPTYEYHPAEQHRISTTPPPLTSHRHPVIQNHELPQLPLDGPYSEQGNQTGPKRTPMEVPPSSRGPVNGTPHEPAPHSVPPEYRSRISFPPQELHSNGDTQRPLPRRSTPLAPYSTPAPPTSHTPAPDDSRYYQSQSHAIGQRKAVRAQQACSECRTRKAKCDEGRPSCSHCKENKLNCVYKEVPPHKQEKANRLILDQLQSFQEAILDRFDRLDRLNTEHGNNFNVILAKIDSKKAPKKPWIQESKAKDKNIVTIQEQIPEPTETATEQVVPSGEDGELSIPVEHTTAAQKLLLWPSIRNLLRPRECDEDYVMELEKKRGLIRVYGRGEGDETSEDNDLSHPPTFNENQPDYLTSPSNGPWGVYVNQPQIKLENKGLDENGVLTADPDMVCRYHKSYMKHIHQLHPFLDQNDLENKVDYFIRVYCPSKGPMPSPGALSNHVNKIPRGAKRKRSCKNSQGVGCNVQSAAKQDSGRRVEKSIHNAIILLVLALGSICEANPVPGPITDQPVDFRKETIPGPPTHDILSPTGSDSLPQSQGSGYVTGSRTFASPSLVGNRQSGVQGNPIPQDKNLDYIPGLAIYAYATQILGSLQGASRLPHVQAALLAGLYAGQLAHPFQSHGWIYQAARACQVLVRSKRYTQMPDGPDKDLYNFAYWVCFQLESDILAELDLPASGISLWEARISLPTGRFTLDLPNRIPSPGFMTMFYYSAQISLRKILNRYHTELYNFNKKGHTHWQWQVQEIFRMNLESWRNSLPTWMKWKDTDPPSEEINVARLRAMYYGACYIVHRPLLYHALHHYASLDGPSTEATAMAASESQQRSPSLGHGQDATNMVHLSSNIGPASGFTGIVYRDLPTKLQRACKVCIDSAMLSTVAFDGINGRPVVTNIFGTAHAQFGNMLVLSATYMSSLSELVDRNELEKLLKRTIDFLLQSRYISPSLRADARILTEIYVKIFGNPSEWRDPTN